MGKGRQIAVAALVGASALIAVVAPAAGGAVGAAGAEGLGSPGQQCHTIKVYKRVKRWAWVPAMRRVHGRRVVIRRHGRVVRVHRRVWRTRTVLHVVCTPVPAPTVAPPGPLNPVAPTLLPAVQAVNPVPQRSIDVAVPVITGTPQVGQTLTSSSGAWSGSPTSFGYQWLRCDPAGASCAPITLATSSHYSIVAADVARTLRVELTAWNAAGPSAPALSAATAPVAALAHPPASLAPPAIAGTAREGALLSHTDGKWSNAPTSEADQWLRCNTSGTGCQAISGASGETYAPNAADVGHTLELQETASNGAGPSAPASSTPSEVVIPALAPPENTARPKISGTPQQGVTLVATPGTWTNSPTEYTYAWSRCGPSGTGCEAIPAAGSSTFTLGEADVGHTLRVTVAASNAAGPSAPARSAPTEVVTAAPEAPTNVSPPTISGTAVQGQTLDASPGSWTSSPSGFSYQWLRCDTAGANCSSIPLATTASYAVVEPDVGSTLRVAVVASNSTGASAPATSAPTEVVTAASKIPVNTNPPQITGVAQQGKTLGASTGAWTNSPESFSYRWIRCDAQGESCAAITQATTRGYTLTAADVGATLRVRVSASNAFGESASASSAQSAVASSWAGISHLEYVFEDGVISVYDIDHEQKLVKTISLSQTASGIRGMAVYPPTHRLFIFYGGDGGPFGHGSVLAYDLVKEEVAWTVHLQTGIDSGAVSPDGTKLYVPTGENDESGVWNVLDSTTGAIIATIQGGAGAHNTIASADGRYVYLGGRNHNSLDVYDTATGEVHEVGPLRSGVRPFTVNADNTIAFTTATNFDGFQVSSLVTNKVLFTVSFGAVPPEFPASAPSHGASLSPDERQLYVIDAVHKVVQAWDVSRVSEGVAPTRLGTIAVSGLLTGSESSCAYECQKGGWLQHTLDGRYVYVGDSGEVIDTATREVVTTLSTLANTKKSMEIDWQEGVPIASTQRTGVGYAE